MFPVKTFYDRIELYKTGPWPDQAKTRGTVSGRSNAAASEQKQMIAADDREAETETDTFVQVEEIKKSGLLQAFPCFEVGPTGESLKNEGSGRIVGAFTP